MLDKCLMNSGLTYSVHNGVIAIKQIEEKSLLFLNRKQH